MKIPASLVQHAEVLTTYYEKNYPALAPLVRDCFLNTIETTVQQLEDGSSFVITGDIPAMWLRDSAAQVKPYVRFAKEDEALRDILESIIQKQAEYVCIDPYANAFNRAETGEGHQDDTDLNDWVWERKYEIDSLCAPIDLAYTYWKEIGGLEIFTPRLLAMMKAIVHTFVTEQEHHRSPYYFSRYGCARSDTLPNYGKGRPVNKTGMTWSGFRPSDDACRFGYLLPANMMAVVALRRMAEMAEEGYRSKNFANTCSLLADEIAWGIEDYGTVEHPKYGRIYAYETDGFGNYLLMDDANSPSLLAMPYLGFCDVNDPLYQATRRFVLSTDNPYYVQGSVAAGVGSPHTPAGYVWHIGIVMQALTSTDRAEVETCLAMLSRTHADTGLMHESFDPNDPTAFSRPWFAWANTLFAQLMDHLMTTGFFET